MPLKTISSSLWIAFLLMFGKLTLWCLVFTKGLTYITKKIQVQETVQRFFSVANFIGKRLCRSLFLQVCKFIKKRLQPVEFVTFLTEHLWWLLLKIVEEKVFSVICSTLATCVYEKMQMVIPSRPNPGKKKRKLIKIFIFAFLCGASKSFIKASLNLLRHNKEVWKLKI